MSTRRGLFKRLRSIRRPRSRPSGRFFSAFPRSQRSWLDMNARTRVLWHLIRPCALVLIGINVVRVLLGVSTAWFFGTSAPITAVALIARGLWYGSIVQAPGLAFVDAAIYLWAGYRGFRRTHLLRTGVVAAGSTSLIGFTMLFSSLAITTPALLLAPFSKP